MSEAKGKLVTCDRCGKTTFRKYIGQGDADGGYTKWDKFEPLPETWLWTTEVGILCDECAGIFRSFIRLLMGDSSVAPVWQLKPSDEKYTNLVRIVNPKEVHNEQT